MKITQKLIALTLCIGLIPVLGMGVFYYFYTQDALTRQIDTQIQNTATRQADKIQEHVNRDLEQLNIFTNREQVRSLVRDYNVASNGAKVAKVSALNRLLADIREEDRSFRRLAILDVKGRVIGSSDPRLVGRDYAQSEIFQRGSQTADASIFLPDIDGKLAHYLAAPLMSNDQKVGVAMLEAQVDSYRLILNDYTDLAQTGETFLVRKPSNGTWTYLAPLRFDAAAPGKTYKPLDPQQTTDYRDQAVLAVTRTIAATDWTVGVKIDQTEVLAPVVQLRNITLAIIALTTIVVSLVSWYFSRLITRPIYRLTQIAVKIQGGDLRQRAIVGSKDEIGILSTAFNAMTARLIASYEVLEQKVIERTKALNQKVHELGDAHAKDNAILTSIGDGMIVTDSAGKILLINEIAATMLGLDLSVMESKNIASYELYDDSGKLIPPERRPVQVALSTRQKVVEDVKSMHDGIKYALNITATPVLQQDQLIGSVQIIHDITKEKEVDRMKTEFISLASHQLRTPLSAIKWYSEMLAGGDAGPLNPEQGDFVKNIAESTERMIQLVSSLLNVARIESGRIIIAPKPTDLKTLVTGIVNDLKGKTVEKKQSLIVSVHSELPNVNIDPQLIGQVYLNLLTNAIKYTPKDGEISVIISRKGDEIISQVTDNGYGIPKSEQPKMFQKFFRAQNIIKVESDGTGLGMYLVKAVIESTGGKVWFESEEGKGTTFWFSLPISGMKARAGEVTLDAPTIK